MAMAPVAMAPVAMVMTPVPMTEVQMYARRAVVPVVAAAARLAPAVVAMSAPAVIVIAVHLLDRGVGGGRLRLRRERSCVGAERDPVAAREREGTDKTRRPG